MIRYEVNEVSAFHGAAPENIQAICKEGFDPQRAGEGVGKMFGVAAYFAANASKSDVYTDNLAANRCFPRSAHRQIFLARVALGKTYNTLEPHPDRHRAPDGDDSVWAEDREHTAA